MERIDFVMKIEAELDKPKEERNEDKLAFWQLDKIPAMAQGKTSIIVLHLVLHFYMLFNFIYLFLWCHAVESFC